MNSAAVGAGTQHPRPCSALLGLSQQVSAFTPSPPLVPFVVTEAVRAANAAPDTRYSGGQGELPRVCGRMNAQASGWMDGRMVGDWTAGSTDGGGCRGGETPPPPPPSPRYAASPADGRRSSIRASEQTAFLPLHSHLSVTLPPTVTTPLAPTPSCPSASPDFTDPAGEDRALRSLFLSGRPMGRPGWEPVRASPPPRDLAALHGLRRHGRLLKNK